MALTGGTSRLSAPRRAMVKGTRRAEVGSARPVTTTPSRARAEVRIWKSTVTVSPSETCTFSRCVWACPSRVTCTVYSPDGTLLMV
jgi:hypothetical protein